MLDQIDSRMWADHGHEFSDWVGRAVNQALLPFQRLNAIQFDAPWRHGPRRQQRHGQA